MYYELSQIICACYLCVLSVWDIFRRKLPPAVLGAGILLAAGYQCIWGKRSVVLCLAGVGAGCVFLLVSKATRQAFGYGDSILILVLGIYLGFWNLLSLLVVSFCMTAAAAVGVLVTHKFNRKSTLPFVPFLGIGYVLLVLAGGFYI